MRKLCVALLILLGTGLLKAQPYQPLVTQTKQWFIRSYEFGIPIYDFYYAQGDTLINGLSYRFLHGYHYNKNFLLREDLSQRQVFILINNGAFFQEYLLYDFSLQVGDSIYLENPVSPVVASEGMYELDSMVPRNLQGQMRRYFYLSAKDTASFSPHAEWIEGIGSTALINTPGAQADSVGLTELLCAYENGQKIYQRRVYDSCYSIAGLSESRPLQGERFLLFGDGHYQFDLKVSGACQLKVFDLTGRLQIKETLIGQGKGRLRLPTGQIFLIQITGANGALVFQEKYYQRRR